MISDPRLRFPHEIERSGPVVAPGGALRLQGWCLAAEGREPPQVRLTLAGRTLVPVETIRREDVCGLHGAPPACAECGFVLEGRVPVGVHLAVFAASTDGSTWLDLRQFTVVATAGVLRAAVERPGDAIGPDSVRVQGWCAHPDRELAEVRLHYGNRQVACEYGLPRRDVPGLLPSSPDAARAGFITAGNIPVGRGALRVRATARDGTVFFARTGRLVDVRCDENHPVPLDLGGPRAVLGPAQRAGPAAPPARAERPRRILFVLYGDLTSNSAIHVAALANELAARGHECVVTVPRAPETLRHHRGARFRCEDFAAVPDDGGVFAGGRPADIVHAWTTREVVRRFCERIGAGRASRLVVHLEDHEQRILEATVGRPAAELAALSPTELADLVPEDLSHPVRGREFLEAAAGVTVIIDRLRELVPAGRPVHTVWPAAEAGAFFPRPRPDAMRAALGWGDDRTVLAYHGNLHPANRDEMAALHAAVVALNDAGAPTTLLRFGRDFCPLPHGLGAAAAPHVLALGRVDNHHLGALLALADFFVQPGESDPFNDYRFPSKLPEFFALGRPVILPRTNLGCVVRHGVDAYVVERADAAGIAGAVRHLRREPDLAARLAAGAARFAAERFGWPRSADALQSFYDSLFS